MAWQIVLWKSKGKVEQTFFYHCSQEFEAPAMGLDLKLILVKNLFFSEENYIKLTKKQERLYTSILCTIYIF